MKRMRQRSNKKMLLCRMGCGCAGDQHVQRECEVDRPPGLPQPSEREEKRKEIMAVEEPQNPDQWERIPITVDSGAVDTVGPKAAGKHFEIEETEDSLRGRNYKAANGEPIKNYGQRRITGLTNQGKEINMKMVVADVTKVLASVAKMVECGNTVVFDEDESYVLHKKTGVKTPIEKRNGMFVIDMWVKRPSDTMNIEKDSSKQDFTRLGADQL